MCSHAYDPLSAEYHRSYPVGCMRSALVVPFHNGHCPRDCSAVEARQCARADIRPGKIHLVAPICTLVTEKTGNPPE